MTSNQRVYWLIHDAEFTIAPDAHEAYLSQIDLIARVTAKGIFVYGTGPATNAVKAEARRFATRHEAMAAIDEQARGPHTKASRHLIDLVRRCRNGVALEFDTKHQIVEIKVPPRPPHKRYFLETLDEIESHARDLREAWKQTARGQKVYYIIDYENFDVNPLYLEEYVRLINEFFAMSALGVVRYNANLIQSTAIRYQTVKGERPVNLYKARADALAVVEAMQDGRVKFSEPDVTMPRTAKCSNGIVLTYYQDKEIIEVGWPAATPEKPFLIETATEVRRYLQEITLAWRELTNAKRVYWVDNYEHFSVNPGVREAFDRDIRDLLRFAAIALLRFHTTLAQKISLRRANTHNPSETYIYDSRDEAFRAVASMRSRAQS